MPSKCNQTPNDTAKIRGFRKFYDLERAQQKAAKDLISLIILDAEDTKRNAFALNWLAATIKNIQQDFAHWQETGDMPNH